MNEKKDTNMQRDFTSITKLVEPRSVAVIGASSDSGRIGGRPIKWMLKAGYTGKIFPVNPNREEIQGLKAYPSIADLPEAPDAAIIAVSASHVSAALEELGNKGVGAAIIFSSGFAEVGDEGAAAQADLLDIARRHGIRLLGPNSLGMFNARRNYYPTFTSAFDTAWPRSGGVSIVSQSGAFGSNLATLALEKGLGAPLCIMTGNEADLTVGELIGWLATDPETRVIAAYMEGINDGDTLIAGLEAARQAKKPVILMKVGRSSLGSAAAASHTASIAGDDVVADAVFRELGVIRVKTATELLEFADIASHGIYPANNTLGVLTVSGGAGVLMSDAAEDFDVSMPAMPETAQAEMKEILPFGAFRNPIDCTAHLINDTSLLDKFMSRMLADGGYSSIISFFAKGAGIPPFAPILFEEMERQRLKYPDRLFIVSGIASEELRRRYAEIGISVFEDASSAVRAVAAMGQIGDTFAALPESPPNVPDGIDLPDDAMSEAAAKSVLTRHGIRFAREKLCADADAAVAEAEAIGFPVVMKIVSPDIPHKTEIGGVLLAVPDAAAARAGFDTLLQRAAAAQPSAHIEGVLVAETVSGGIETIMGVKNDPAFGPVAMFGLGGIYTEIMQDVVFRRCPFSPAVAEKMIESTRAGVLLRGVRGQPGGDMEAAAEMLSALSVFAAGAGDRIDSIDMNPVIVKEKGKGAVALDALIALKDASKP
ncbi:acetate--CoA ligase family protein [Pseudooceanicola sp.]|uniref:acetate--CoA ligase family protein n=1 Tax=Pseudooceanicola sp. TaxID=1914328 RepID=UPI00261D2E80|nr:acetate--CoA ligase family protein [Pseudooceanicola sp.]MDF1855083.1 acetate--CoA ligase family protein [Pseudooceanicola sp.]